MSDDPIVEETRKAREEIVAACGEDVHAFFEYLRERESRSQRAVIALAPNGPEPGMHASESR
ncbi:MAG: hypothetical protein QOC81_4546 [Thermoanaerobaculia bacterium]|jgi:hypothetical protein|nr:hypothetical protein [Thermoanaerobaculia bacterium]